MAATRHSASNLYHRIIVVMTGLALLAACGGSDRASRSTTTSSTMWAQPQTPAEWVLSPRHRTGHFALGERRRVPP